MNLKKIEMGDPQGSERIACENAIVVDATPFRGFMAKTTHEEMV
jgi:hypothetical protein